MQVKPMVMKQQGFTIIELVVVILLLGILAATALPRFIDVTTSAHTSVFEATSGGVATGVALYRAEWTARGQGASNSALSSYGGLRAAPGYSNGSYTARVAPSTPSAFTTPANFTGRSTGYPLATTSSINKATAGDFTAMSSEHCAQVFTNVLQVGAPTIVRAVNNSNALITTATALGGVNPNTQSAVDSAVTTFSGVISTSATRSIGDFTAILVTVEIDTGFENNQGDGTPTNGSGLPRNHVDNVPGCVYAYTGEAENYTRTILYVPWTGRVESFTTLEALIRAAQYQGPRVS